MMSEKRKMEQKNKNLKENTIGAIFTRDNKTSLTKDAS